MRAVRMLFPVGIAVMAVGVAVLLAVAALTTVALLVGPPASSSS